MNSQLTPSVSALKQALRKAEHLKAKISEINEPIAVIGLAFRFPGEANNPETFWSLLCQKKDPIHEIPSDRWSISDYYDPNPDTPGKMYVKSGGFIRGVDRFDAPFFSISPREAIQMDPQQRLLLEVSWKALENAGQASLVEKYRNSGVFVGIASDDYMLLGPNAQDVSRMDAYSGLGVGRSIAAGRVAYALGLEGPTVQVDTACSSSLVAVHLAVQSLRLRESDMALAGGVHLMLSPSGPIMRCRLRALSPDGRCKTFDAAANGYGESEGCGIVVLKRLSDAVADDDNILAVIRGSAINHDGAGSGLIVPNEHAQVRVLRQALKNAQVDAADISYIEAHGTGTSLGDPIEVGALATVFGSGRSFNDPLLIGAVKSNIGHLEAAAGVAGLIKTVLALHHQQIPPNLHFNQPSPHIPWENLPIKIPTEVTPWTKEHRFAGVSAFGLSGTNAHVILAEAPVLNKPPKSDLVRSLHLFTLSGKTAKALQQSINRYEIYLKANPDLRIEDICFTANTGRWPFRHRLSLVAASTSELYGKLVALRDNKEVSGVIQQEVQGSNPPRKAFLFTGHGSLYVNMGRELYETQPTFRQMMQQCADIFRNYLEEPLLDVLYPVNKESPSPLLHEMSYAQCTIFSLEYSLTKLWQSWGIEPDIVMGHSTGEYAAACIAGVFSLEDGAKLVATRSRLMESLPRDGQMVAVFTNRASIEAAIEPFLEGVSIAVVNGLENIVISGYQKSIELILAILAKQNVKYKVLPISHAAHSPLMDPILADFRHVAETITYTSPQIPFVSNVTGGLISHKIATPEYWCQHIRQPVQFATGMNTLHQQGFDMFIEVGPHPTLLGLGTQCIPVGVRAWLPSLRQDRGDWQQILQSLGAMFVWGIDTIDWLVFDRDYQRKRIMLPATPYQRHAYWLDRISPEMIPSLDAVNIPIAHLLHQGDVQQLAHLLQQTGQFSAQEASILHKLVDVFINEYQKQVTTHRLEQQVDTTSQLLQELAECSPAARIDRLVLFVQEQIWQILGFDPTQNLDTSEALPKLDIHQTPGEAGLDSIMWLELLKRIEQHCAISIELGSFFSRRYTLQELALKIEELLTTTSAPTSNVATSGEISTLTEADLAALRAYGYVNQDDIVPQSYLRIFEHTDILQSFMVSLAPDLRLEVLTIGDGEPLVLLCPGFTAAPAWKYQIDAFCKQFRVIVMHYPGYARSSLNYRYASARPIAHLLGIVLELLGVNEPINLIGWSTGGGIAQMFAVAYPKRLKTLTLTNTAAKSHYYKNNSLDNVQEALLTIEDDFHQNFPEHLQTQKKLYRKLLDIPDYLPNPSLNLHYSAEMSKVDLVDDLSRTDIPTLVIQGGKDKLCTVEDGRFLANHIKQAQYYEFKDSGHHTPLYHHDAFNQVWLNFWMETVNQKGVNSNETKQSE